MSRPPNRRMVLAYSGTVRGLRQYLQIKTDLDTHMRKLYPGKADHPDAH